MTVIVAAALLASGVAGADASSGEYLGYRLGDRFVAPENATPRPHVAGPLVYDFLADSRDHGVETVTLYVSPESAIIGSIFGEWYFSSKQSAKRFADRYLATLSRNYDQWESRGRSLTRDDYQLAVEVQKRRADDGFWPSTKKYRVAASLIYAPESLGRGEWMAIVNLETSNLQLTANQ